MRGTTRSNARLNNARLSIRLAIDRQRPHPRQGARIGGQGADAFGVPIGRATDIGRLRAPVIQGADADPAAAARAEHRLIDGAELFRLDRGSDHGVDLILTYQKKYMKIIFKQFITALSLGILTTNITMAQSHQKLNNYIMENHPIHYRNIKVNDLNLFYREAGPADAPTILLLHGYPTSSHMFRNLIPILSKKYHVIAPDLPGFGYSDAPDHTQFSYTFDNLAETVQAFVDKLEMKRYAVYIFDYGAPVGLRLAMNNPEKITGIVSQNGNAYEEGLSSEWNPIQKYWKEPSQANRLALKDFVSIAASASFINKEFTMKSVKRALIP